MLMIAQARSKFIQLALLLCVGALSSCTFGGSKIKNLSDVSNIEKPNAEYAYLIGRVTFSAKFDDYGNAGDDIKKPDTYSVGFTICPSDTRSDIYENRKCDFSLKGTKYKLGEFFAVKIKPTDKFAWMDIWTETKTDPSIKETDNEKKKQIKKALSKYKGGFSQSGIREFYLNVGALEGGKVYFIGDVFIPLDNSSFLEYGDQNFEKRILLHTVPKDIVLKDSSNEAKEWAKEKLKYNSEIVKPKLKLTPSKIKSLFRQVFVTYY